MTLLVGSVSCVYSIGYDVLDLTDESATQLDVSDGQHETIVTLLENAHNLNIKSRFWNTNDISDSVRERIWTELVADGTDFLNADDLQAAQDFIASASA